MRKPLIGLLTIALLLVAAASARAVPPPDEQPPEESTRQEHPQFLRPIEGETSISGSVSDQTQNPMSGVMVKLFVDGLNVASATTDLAGSYELRYPIDVGKDKTVMLWYVTPGA
ncbi:MAG: carboxypeptidase regulatory-like domain-containing protein, partial [Candidatus Eiseniibacteriota bacterium]